MITNFKKRTHREFARKIDESRARFETMAAENNKNQQAVTSKEGQPIEEGDHVSTKIRGGRHEGDVSLQSSFSNTSFPPFFLLSPIGVGFTYFFLPLSARPRLTAAPSRAFLLRFVGTRHGT